MSEATYEPGYSQMGKLSESAGGQVPRALTRQAQALESLHGVISDLESRTQSVRIGKPEKASDSDPPRPVLAGLATEIESRTDMVEQATRRLTAILHELEI